MHVHVHVRTYVCVFMYYMYCSRNARFFYSNANLLSVIAINICIFEIFSNAQF